MQPETVGSLEILPWTEDSEVSLIQSMDIGLMPLPETPWTRGKCGLQVDPIHGVRVASCGITSRRQL